MESPDNWQRLKDLFEEAARLAPEDRSRFLEDHCADDDELARTLMTLLRSHDSATEFLSSPTDADAQTHTATALAAPEEPGSLIGKYKLLQCIGEGGFGVVYMAEQQSPIVRKVALKVIKRGMDTRQVVARFEAERQALALLDHPNIAKVLDAGATEAGRPYFVMELVRGIPINDYCDQSLLSNRERLDLFLLVCHAVEHAHQKGIIHRDLKPGNVLVTLHDGRPVPKIIDFGIAKATSMRLTERTLFTEFGVFIGTPEYMSPEQAALGGLDVDTRSDIYSLGAVLYELLTGTKPFDPARLRSQGYGEMQRVIREVDPAKPSTRVTELGAHGMIVARQRGLTPRALARALRGEPDWIVMKALSKDRTCRYPSAGAFAADIQHHLRSEPVSAGPPGVAYRARRFLRRHSTAVAVTTIVLLALVVGGALATAGFVRARRAELIARREATRKGIEAGALRASLRGDYSTYMERTRKAIELQREASRGKPEELTVYLADLLAFLGTLEWIGESRAKPLRLEIESETLRRVIDSGTPADTSTLQILEPMIGYAKEYRNDLLVPLLRRAVAVRARLPIRTPSLAEDRKRLARLLDEDAERLLASGRPAEARSLLMGSGDRWKEIYPLLDGSEEGAYAEGLLGACLSDLGDYSGAEPLLLGSWRKLNSREQLVRVIELYRRWGRPALARSYTDQMLVDAVRDVGPLPATPSVASQSVARSGSLRGRTIWLFGGTVVRRARNASVSSRANTWGWSASVHGRTFLEHAVDSEGVPKELLPLTAEERTYQAQGTNGSIDLSPGPVIEDHVRGRALVVYAKDVRRGEFVTEPLGSSIAVWSGLGVTPIRPIVREGTPEPTLLFQGNEPRFAAGAVAVRDTLYLYATRPIWLANEVLVARSPLARALERRAWSFYAGAGEWSADISRAADVMLAGPHLSVHWNAYLGKYLAVTGQTLGDKIELRLADRPEGPWSRAYVIGTGLKPRHLGGWSCDALAHSALAGEGGRVEYLTYRREVADFSSEIRLMEIVFHRRDRRASR